MCAKMADRIDTPSEDMSTARHAIVAHAGQGGALLAIAEAQANKVDVPEADLQHDVVARRLLKLHYGGELGADTGEICATGLGANPQRQNQL